VRTIIPYDKRGIDRGLVGLWQLARRLRATRYDVALLAQGSWRSAALAQLAGIPARIGFSTSAGCLLYTKRVPYRDDLHHAARLLMLARPTAREPLPAELRPSLAPGQRERDAVDRLLAAAGVRADEPLVGLAPGSVWATKRWPYYPELAQELADSARIVVLGSAGDASLAQAIVLAVPSAIDATGQLSLLASAELVRRCGVLVTNDSAPMHLASAMETPTVAIFGPTVPAFGFGPLATRASVVGHESLPCRPCDRHGPQRCPLGHFRCMRELAPALVAERVRALLLNPDVLA
jgi:heptosyltransferase-2